MAGAPCHTFPSLPFTIDIGTSILVGGSQPAVLFTTGEDNYHHRRRHCHQNMIVIIVVLYVRLPAASLA
jgi:hypothetical protein